MSKLMSAVFAVLFSMTLVAHAEEAAPVASAPTGKITKLVVTTGVQDRDPVDEITTNTSAEKVYCWVRAELDNAPTTIKHVWSLGGEVQGEVEGDQIAKKVIADYKGGNGKIEIQTREVRISGTMLLPFLTKVR